MSMKPTIAAAVAALSLAAAGTASAGKLPAEHVQSAGVYANPTTTTVYVSAFPTGGKGSGTERTCEHWSGILAEDQENVDTNEANNDLSGYKDAMNALNDDADAAMDAGCVVIY